MKVIQQKHEIQPTRPLWERIEHSGRLCYKSEDKVQEGTAKPFVLGCLKQRHMSVLEMAPICVLIGFPGLPKEDWDATEMAIRGMSKFLNCSVLMMPNDAGGRSPVFVASGPARAFMELDAGTFSQTIHNRLHEVYPELFEKTEVEGRFGFVEIVTDAMITTMPREARDLHTYVTVRFITKRSVSHELVRHRPMSLLQESQRYCRYDQAKFGSEVTFIDPYPAFDCYALGTAARHEWLVACEAAEASYMLLLEGGASPQAARLVLPNSCKTEVDVMTNLTHWSHILYLRTSAAADPAMQALMKPLLAEFRMLYPDSFTKLTRIGISD